MWRLWCKALGEKASNCDNESDKVAITRTFILLTYLITNIFIIAGNIRHWNDLEYTRTIQKNQIGTTPDSGCCYCRDLTIP